MLRAFLVRLGALVFRRRFDAGLDEEMRYHLERDVERNIAAGMSPVHARNAARRAFGNLTVATEQARDASRWRFIEELGQDVGFAVRSFRHAPSFVLTVVVTIGLGLGLLATAVTVFDAYVLRPVPVRDPSALQDMLWRSKGGAGHGLTLAQYRRLGARRDPFSESFAYVHYTTRLRGSVAIGQLVTSNYFDVLGVPPVMGRTLVAGDGAFEAGRDVVVLSHRTWRSVFGGDSSVLGKPIRLGTNTYTVIGVAREGFGGLG